MILEGFRFCFSIVLGVSIVKDFQGLLFVFNDVWVLVVFTIVNSFCIFKVVGVSIVLFFVCLCVFVCFSIFSMGLMFLCILMFSFVFFGGSMMFDGVANVCWRFQCFSALQCVFLCSVYFLSFLCFQYVQPFSTLFHSYFYGVLFLYVFLCVSWVSCICYILYGLCVVCTLCVVLLSFLSFVCGFLNICVFRAPSPHLPRTSGIFCFSFIICENYAKTTAKHNNKQKETSTTFENLWKYIKTYNVWKTHKVIKT